MSSFEDDEDDYPAKRRRPNDDRNNGPVVNCGENYQEDGVCPLGFGRGKRRGRRNNGDGDGLVNGENDGKEESSDEEIIFDSDSDIPLDDIDNMLEEGLREGLERGKASSHQHSYPTHEERKKIVLKKREQDYFEMLPEGWIEVTHFSGMPIYLHKQSRVCTLSKPYYLGPGSARKHEVPISAIPCLAYKKEIEKEKSQELKENNSSTTEEIVINSHNDCPNQAETIFINGGSGDKNNQLPIIAKVESVQEAKKEKSLDYLSIRDYCSKVFEFQEITIRKFKTWADRRRHVQLRKMQQRPSLPEGTKLITCPLPKHTESGDPARRSYRKEFVMNPAGKSAVCILHEFVQHAERVQPKYVFKELENASMPYSATVLINDMEYGVGYGSSKKQAKSEAARATLEILIPDIRDMTQDGNGKVDTSMQDLTFFDDIKVEDPRVSEMCAKAGQHSPYQILVECLKRNYGMGDTEIKTDVRLVKHQKNEFTMKVGKHSATVICRNKREGKQRAAQAILQLLHPQINSWGSLLRLYGRGSCKTPKEKKEEEQKITELQNTACANRPNYAILNKLREEMLKLRASNLNRDQSKEPLRLILCTDEKRAEEAGELGPGREEGEGEGEGERGNKGSTDDRDEMEEGEVDPEIEGKEETEERKIISDESGEGDPEEGELSNSPIDPNLCNQTMESIKSFENSLSNVSDNSSNSMDDEIDDEDDDDDMLYDDNHHLPSTSFTNNQRNENNRIIYSNTAQTNISNVLNISVSSISSNSSCNSSPGEI